MLFIAGTHLETRVLALLRKLESAATMPSVTLGRGGKAGSSARGNAAAGFGKQTTLGFNRSGAQPPNKRRRTGAAEPEPVASHAPAPSAYVPDDGPFEPPVQSAPLTHVCVRVRVRARYSSPVLLTWHDAFSELHLVFVWPSDNVSASKSRWAAITSLHPCLFCIVPR